MDKNKIRKLLNSVTSKTRAAKLGDILDSTIKKANAAPITEAYTFTSSDLEVQGARATIHTTHAIAHIANILVWSNMSIKSFLSPAISSDKKSVEILQTGVSTSDRFAVGDVAVITYMEE